MIFFSYALSPSPFWNDEVDIFNFLRRKLKGQAGVENLFGQAQAQGFLNFFNSSHTPIGQSLLKLDESQRKCLESLFNTAYGVVKAGKPFSDYERRPKEIYLPMSFEMFSLVSPYHT
jgi:hypothetical protein